MKLHLKGPSDHKIKAAIQITGSKSESNRALLLQALFPSISIRNRSNSDDAAAMQKGLAISKGKVDIHHAGTAMRFLTGYFASQEGKNVILTGSQRMTERPIKVLVDALQSLGAAIDYVDKEGYPPISIKGNTLTKNNVRLPANISSQYISALLLIAPSLENGLELELIGKITSVPYIQMTLGLLNQIGVHTSFESNTIKVSATNHVAPIELVVESDWSSASYYYSIVALSELGSEIQLGSYKKESLQGDSVLAEIYKHFGVETTFLSNEIVLKKEWNPTTDLFSYDLANAPDIAQTIVVTCLGLGLACDLTGLHTLKIKETDRLEAMQAELTKFGAVVTVTDRSLHMEPTSHMASEVAIATYNDHRMAMAFAPLALKTSFEINDAEVVSKSYPDFWEDLKILGFRVQEL
ncbi:MAG: 3-phosphoshikimate 1-carboxyvinyltransferase [Maribacter sp.]|uniref:3-phosphoshikimate 1-carboxyvinyltransferase n=1 Tax=Maribacter sp. TaxID=1897614 RepID=UPI003C76E6E9